jgi:hypothetical protein
MGGTKKHAEQDAARRALERLEAAERKASGAALSETGQEEASAE